MSTTGTDNAAPTAPTAPAASEEKTTPNAGASSEKEWDTTSDPATEADEGSEFADIAASDLADPDGDGSGGADDGAKGKDDGEGEEGVKPSDDGKAPEQTGEVPTAEKPTGQEAKPKTEDEGQPTKPAESEADKTDQQKPAETPAAETPTPQMSPEEAAAARQKWLDESVAQLSTNFKLSEEEAQELEDNPSEFMPKLAARGTVLAIEAATQTILSQMPNVVEGVIQMRESRQADEGTFFEAWPQLDRSNKDHFDTVMRLGMAYRSANRTATPEQFTKDVGIMAMMELGIPFEEQQQQAAADQTSVTPPPTPAGTTPTSQPDTKPKNEFEVIASEDLEPE